MEILLFNMSIMVLIIMISVIFLLYELFKKVPYETLQQKLPVYTNNVISINVNGKRRNADSFYGTRFNDYPKVYSFAA